MIEIQDMFNIVAEQIQDVDKRRDMYNVIRSCISMRNRSLKDSCNIDVIFTQYENFMNRMSTHEQKLLKELFIMSGHIKEDDEADDDDEDEADDDWDEENDADEEEEKENDVLVISAVGYKQIKILIGDGKMVTINI